MDKSFKQPFWRNNLSTPDEKSEIVIHDFDGTIYTALYEMDFIYYAAHTWRTEPDIERMHFSHIGEWCYAHELSNHLKEGSTT